MNRLAIAVVALVGCGGPEDLASTEGDARTSYSIISVTTDSSVSRPLEKVDTVVQAGSDARNRFTWHRVYDSKRKSFRGAVLLVPSWLHNFGEYLLDVNGDATQSLAGVLALAGYDVHGYSPRATGLAGDACSSGAVDCSIMATWGLQTYVNDIEFIRKKIGADPVIGGLSLGAGVGLAAVNANPTGYEGLIYWDSLFYTTDPAILQLNAGNCAFLTSLIDNGIAYEEGAPQGTKFVILHSEELCTQALGSPNPNFGTPDFRIFAPNDTFTQLKFSDYPRVRQNAMHNINNVDTLAVFRDGACAWAGDRTFSGNLHNFTKPVFAIKEGLASGPYMQETLDLFGSPMITVIDNPEFGHFDTLGTANQGSAIQQPLLKWLGEKVF